ncbi:tryptophan 2,3-dioxygenase family protein [Streptomyces sp. NPDC091383]|uniref:tryptophan 2,3-dioxygenase family protein n=1 Tax=Streptomyces sp. NPDC091383 TaxID=3365996 RepID=UPI00381D407C
MTTLNYADYLLVDDLLSLQRTLAPPETTSRAVVLAEHFFIVAHQSCELWLKQVTLDLEAAADAMTPPNGPEDGELALEYLLRSTELLRVLHEQVLALERLPLRHFAAFRPFLDGASGAQSAQFHQLSRLLGDERRQGRLYRAFEQLSEEQGLSVSEVCARGTRAGVLNRIADSLLDVANGYWHWKLGHLALVSKMVGSNNGTGGSTGVDHLARRVSLPFAELRQLRAQVHEKLS